MKSLNENIRHTTAIITDIRNFTSTFKKFQIERDASFFNFINTYYDKTNEIISILSDDVYISSTGDGTITLFLGDDHYLKGYSYVLIIHKLLDKMCRDFNTKYNAKISFGIGSDSGNVWKIGEGHLRTYVGTVINRAARIEASTKLFGITKTAIGDSLYKHLLNYIDINAYETMLKYDNYDTLIAEKPSTILVSKKLLLQYIFDMELKGIEKNAPIFRLSETLYKNDDLYWEILRILLNNDKLKKIHEILL